MPVEIDIAQGLDHALELLGPGDPEIRPVAGATDVILRLHAGRLKARRLISIADLPDLSYVRPESERICLGAGTLISDLMVDHEFAAEFPSAVRSAREFASPQIRNRATVGGNIGNASPAADMVPPLIALGAEVALRSHRGTRTLPLEDVFLGLGKTVLRADELITEIAVPRRRSCFQSFAKFGSRSANVISVINVAICLRLEDGQIAEARVAYGCVAPKPIRGARVEQFLLNRTVSEQLVREVADVVLADISPIDDVRGSRGYKQRLAVNATQDALSRALEELRA